MNEQTNMMMMVVMMMMKNDVNMMQKNVQLVM
jgi:hypothetical protein